MATLTNRWTNPSAETNTTGYTAIAGTGGAAAISRPTTGGKAGSAFARCTWSAATTAAGGGIQYGDIAVTAGQVYSFGVFVKCSITNRFRLDIEWRSGAATVSTSLGAETVLLTDPDWADAPRLKVEGLTAPATATIARVKVISVAGTSFAQWAAGSTLDLDAGMAVQAATLPAYDDPSTSLLWEWSGAAHASQSVWYQGAIAITQYLGADPCPRVEVLVTDLAAAVKYLTVHRLAGGRDHEVRGAVAAAVAGALTRIDFEIPFGVACTYKAEMFDANMNSLGFTVTADTTLEVDGTWIHNPLDPQGAMEVGLIEPTGTEVSYPIDGDIVYPLGRRVGVLISSQRRGAVGYPLVVETLDAAAREKLTAMLGTPGEPTAPMVPPVLCVRTPEPIDIPRPFFVGVLTPKSKTQNVLTGATVVDHDLSGDEVAPPTPGLFIPLLTRADLNAYYSTRSALNADNLTRLAVNRRYDLAGTA